MEFKKETLKNGVRLLTLPMPHLDSVTVIIGVSAGSRFEEVKNQGVAHFTEHMLFKGTKKRPNNRVIATELESMGAAFNAFTGQDITAYYVQAAAKNLGWGLDILTDMVFNSKFDPKEIEKEKGVIIEELRMNHDNPQDWVENLSLGQVFPNHPLGRLITGTEETIRGMQRNDFLSYLDGWYRSPNLVAIIAGNLSQKKALAQARGLLANLPKRSAAGPLEFTYKQKQAEVLVEERPTDQTHYILGVRGYPRSHPKREALELLVTALGGGMSSRLFEEIREKRGLAYYVGAASSEFSDTGVVMVRAGVNSQKSAEAIKVTVGELARLKEEAVPEKELAKAKEMIRGHLLLGVEGTGGAGMYALGQEVLEGEFETPEEKLARIDAATTRDLQQVAQDIFVENNLNLALIGPHKDPSAFKKLLSL
ncbi:MAG: pitrilysin family protein [Patescibacteria group bacterium]